MTQEEKQKLLKDITARLPYQPMCEFTDTEDDFCKITKKLGYSLRDFVAGKIIIKPYLRSLSSMIEEEKKELSKKYVWNIWGGQIQIRYHSQGCWDDETECPTEEYIILFDWLNEHHFDYRGLIEKGLALEAPEGMYVL